MENNDLTGTPPSARDLQEAQAVVRKAIVTMMAKIPPELAIQLPNILRCLMEVEQLNRLINAGRIVENGGPYQFVGKFVVVAEAEFIRLQSKQ